MQTYTITPLKIYSAYEDKPRLQISFTGPGRTRQSFKADADINTIVNRYLRTGVLEYARKMEPRYGDTTGIEFTSAMQTVAAAQSLFNEMPGHLRARFDNEPAKFLDFIHDKDNTEEARELGLLKPLPAAVAAAALQALPTSHREDGSAAHEPLRAKDGTFREHTRSEKRAEAREAREAGGADKTNTST